MKKPPSFTLPEPEAVREIHAVRRRIQRRAEKIAGLPSKGDEPVGSERIGVVPVAARRAEQFAADFPEPPLQLAAVVGRLPAHDSGGKDEFVAEHRRDRTASFQ
jgi:hypothetical protein